MNLIFFTQSRSLDVFYQLYLRLMQHMEIGRVGFYVANIHHYEEFIQVYHDFEAKFVVVKEWEVYQEAEKHRADLGRISAFEEEIGEPTLWGPVVNDRRLYMGKNVRFGQDYRPRFSHQQQLNILDVALQRIDRMFQEVEPDLVCTIYAATIGDYVGHLLARARGIRSLDMRLARLKNYVMFVDGINEPPPHIAEIFEEFEAGIPQDLREQAESHIASVHQKNATYEGAMSSARQLGGGAVTSARFLSPATLAKVAKHIVAIPRLRKSPYKFDHSSPSPFGILRPRNMLNRLNSMRLASARGDGIVAAGELAHMDYVLYPLHTEPELVMTQFARPYLNQIEVVRNVSLSMPIGMTLLVKDHPQMVGKRTAGYYRKLLEIPNVKILELGAPSDVALEHARLVVIIRGAIGLEAAIKRKPVVSLGRSMFQLLPASMFRTCWNPYELPNSIKDMLHDYRYDHESMVRYLASVMKGSVPANLVTDMLGKKGRFRAGIDTAEVPLEEHPHLDALASHMIERIGGADRLPASMPVS